MTKFNTGKKSQLARTLFFFFNSEHEIETPVISWTLRSHSLYRQVGMT